VIRDSVGNLYGTTGGGGTFGFGTVFKLDTSGKETVLYSFTGGADGEFPEAGLVRDVAGNLYSTTIFGGTSGNCNGGCGTVFKLDTTGKETVLYSFRNGDGAYPNSVIRDSAGNLYGTTYGGGPPSFCFGSGCGVVFKVDTTGKETVLYTFTGGADGANPYAGLVRDAKGNLYGTTSYGGDMAACKGGCGVVFKLDKTGKETVLHRFMGADGASPYAGLVRDAKGNIYGTTFTGGDLTCVVYVGGCGVVFKLGISPF
jgi:uncharacterized repeat protein (TIGR03803 family)